MSVRHYITNGRRLVRERIEPVVRRLAESIPVLSGVLGNPLIDREWYAGTYGHLRGARRDPVRHYRRYGTNHGHHPNPLFDADWYLSRYPDVRAAGADPLDHYLLYGGREGRDPSPYFSTGWYLAHYPDVALTGMNPLLHYLRHGAAEGRRPRPTLDGQPAVGMGIARHNRRLRAALLVPRRIARRVSGDRPEGAFDRMPPLGAAIVDLRSVLSDLDRGAVVAVAAALGDLRSIKEPNTVVAPFPSSADAATAVLGSSTAASAHLAWLRSQGVTHFAVPAASQGWFRHLGAFSQDVDHRFRRVRADGRMTVFDVRPNARQAPHVGGELSRAIDQFRVAFLREPSVLDLTDGQLALADSGVVTPLPLIGEAMPYADASFDLVIVSAANDAALAEAERLATAAVLEVQAESSSPLTSIRWRNEAQFPKLPGASVVIPTHNGATFVERCLIAIEETVAPWMRVEVIIVDDASAELAQESLRATVERHPRASLLHNRTNLGFVGSINRGAANASHEYLVLLNDDTVPLPNWLAWLLRTFRERDDAGVVGGRLIYPGGRLQEAGGVVFSDGSAANIGRGHPNPDAPQFSYVHEVDYVSGALLATRTKLFHEMGGLDHIYGFGYYDDSDYCFKVREAGSRVYLQPESVVVHVEGGSAGTDLEQGPKRSQLINREAFVRRWAHRLGEQPPPDIAHSQLLLEAVSDRGAR